MSKWFKYKSPNNTDVYIDLDEVTTITEEEDRYFVYMKGDGQVKTDVPFSEANRLLDELGLL